MKHLNATQAFVDKYHEHFERGSTQREFAEAMGLNVRTVQRRRIRIEKELGSKLPDMLGSALNRKRNGIGTLDELTTALKGWSPDHDMTHRVPDPFIVKGVSSLYTTGKDGQTRVAAQWVKTTIDPEAREAMLATILDAMRSEIPKVEPVALERAGDDLLLNLFLITDYHIGMLAWGEETGENWDIKIAEDVLVAWFQRAIIQSPPAKTAVFCQLGDFLHWDGMDAVTPEHKNLLDADTRFQKLVRVAIRVLRRVIAILLTQHEHVHVIMAEGNHDPASSVWLRELFVLMFEDEPRISIDRNPDPYYVYEHGRTALFFHHGHLAKIERVDSIFAGKYRDVYGRARHSFAHVGHKHCAEVRESSLMIVEQHRTLSAPDAYASRHGFISGRDAQVITYHREFGDVGRVRISPQMVQGFKHRHPRKVHKTKFKVSKPGARRGKRK